MKTTRYFEEQVLRKRPYLQREWCEAVLAKPLRRELQDDGRIRYWGEVIATEAGEKRILRVVTLNDGEPSIMLSSIAGFTARRTSEASLLP